MDLKKVSFFLSLIPPYGWRQDPIAGSGWDQPYRNPTSRCRSRSSGRCYPGLQIQCHWRDLVIKVVGLELKNKNEIINSTIGTFGGSKKWVDFASCHACHACYTCHHLATVPKIWAQIFAMKKFEGHEKDLLLLPFFQEQCHFGEVPLFMITLLLEARAAMGESRRRH